MEMESNQKVVIDADFFRSTTDHEPGTRLFEALMNDNGYQPVMHKYVSSVELKNNDRLNTLIKNGKIEIVSDNDYIEKNDANYIDYFNEAYYLLNDRSLDGEDVMLYGYDVPRWEESLGEIRSVYLAYAMNYRIILSNDSDTLLLTKRISSSKHVIESVRLEKLLLNNPKQGGSLTWKDIRITVDKVYNNRQEIRGKIYAAYNNS